MESERCWYHHFRATQQTSLDLYLPPPQRFPPPLFPLAPFPQSTPGFLSLTVHVFLSFFLSEAYSTTIPSSVSVLLPSFLPLVAFPWSLLRPGAVIASFASVGFVFTRLVPCAQGRGGCRPVGWGGWGARGVVLDHPSLLSWQERCPSGIPASVFSTLVGRRPPAF